MSERGQASKRILFTGYAPVHFVCFLPVYRRLQDDERVEIWFSGGFRTETPQGDVHCLEGFYDPFDVPREHVIPYEQAQEQKFDACVCAHLSTGLVPPATGRSVQIFHGVSFRNLLARSGKALKFDLLCLPGRYHARLFRKRGLIREQGIHATVTGFPKSDALVDGSMDRARILRAVGVDPAKPTLLYAPTGGRKNSMETMGEEIIRRLGKDSAWNLLVKPHDHPKKKIDWFRRLQPLENERVRLVRDLDLVPYMFAADLLISDASSAAVEYTLLDRPIVFLDVPELLAKVRDSDDTLDLETHGRKIGTCITNPAEIVPAVRDALAHPARERETRRSMAQDIFHRPGHAAERVKSVILYASGAEDTLDSGVEVLESDKTALG